jgi:von Willebrand factor type D domain/Heterokaryon incompatibility protein Het-C
MRGIRFWIIGIISFLTATIWTVFIPNSFLNRATLVGLCTIFSFNSTFCIPNLELESDRVMATSHSNISIIENNRGVYVKKPDRKLLEIKKHRTLIAFESFNNDEGHREITLAALGQINIADNKFQEYAKREIERADRQVDLNVEYLDLTSYYEYQTAIGYASNTLFSEDFDLPYKHFSNEQFKQGSSWLIERRKTILDRLKAITQANDETAKNGAGLEARKLLGQALHTIQDFYAHSNWIELGHKADTNKDLGIRVLCSQPDQVACATPDEPTASKLTRYDRGGLPYTVYDQSTLTPDFKKLTSGYFMGSGPIDSCTAPTGKLRHGAQQCNGFNHDSPKDKLYPIAKELAIKASKDYIELIIDSLIKNDEKNGIEQVKALMGISTEKIPPTTSLKTGSSHNDPHLTTVDGLRYDLQTVGEYILIKSNNGNFEVQNRQEPYNASTAINSAVAIKVGRDRIALYAKEFPDSNTSTPLRVNSKPTTIQGDKLSLADGGEILKQGNTYVIKSAKGEKVLVDLLGSGKSGFLNVSAFVPNRSGTYSGLLGNVNGNPNDDLQTRNGISISANRSSYKSEKLYLEQIDKKFANSWRIKQQESLFDYSVGKNTKSYTDLNFPDSYLANNMLSADRLNKARNACIQAKVSQDLMQDCIYDVGFTGSTEFARATARVSDYAKIVDRLPLETRNSDIKKPSDRSLRIYAESYIRNWATILQNRGAKVSPIRSLIIESTSYPEFPYSGSVTTEAYPTLVFLFYYGQNGWITNSERIRIQGR